jgi:hypothetical protein
MSALSYSVWDVINTRSFLGTDYLTFADIFQSLSTFMIFSEMSALSYSVWDVINTRSFLDTDYLTFADINFRFEYLIFILYNTNRNMVVHQRPELAQAV